MSKIETDLPERLRSAGGSPLEQRLLQAAGGELPSRELSERMARGIGIALPAVGGGAAVGAASKTAVASSKAASAGSSLVPWILGALVATIAGGTFLATRPNPTPSASIAIAAPTPVAAVASAPASLPPAAAAAPEHSAAPPSQSEVTDARKPIASSGPPRARASATANELADQIALVDAARAALASGGATRALASVRDYQTEYPNGTFRPEVAAIKIEALLKLGRKAEARALAERFATNYGPGPLADRVTRLATVEP